MKHVTWQEHIEIAPDVGRGEPCIRGTLVPVAMIPGSLADGMSQEQIQEAYPQLSTDDIRAALAYALDEYDFCCITYRRGTSGSRSAYVWPRFVRLAAVQQPAVCLV